MKTLLKKVEMYMGICHNYFIPNAYCCFLKTTMMLLKITGKNDKCDVHTVSFFVTSLTAKTLL